LSIGDHTHDDLETDEVGYNSALDVLDHFNKWCENEDVDRTSIVLAHIVLKGTVRLLEMMLIREPSYSSCLTMTPCSNPEHEHKDPQQLVTIAISYGIMAEALGAAYREMGEPS